ncbi:MAG: response regulator [Elusimicrobia bacterium]|nr:response regulator [Elusimicrobiota bacterium]
MALILIAEDTPELAGMLKDILESRGHQVALAYDGVQMIEKGKSLLPKLIIADIMMPGAYGSSAYKALQDDPHTKDIPVVFLTAVSPEQAARVVPADPRVKVLHKPVDIVLLLKTVAESLPAA